MKDIAKIANNFEGALQKNAAKSKTPKTKSQVDKAWKKSKETYSKLKVKYDKLKLESDKLTARLEATEGLLAASKREVLYYYNTKKHIDLSGASSVVLYENEARDVGYVIDKEEFHLNLDDLGDVTKTPIKDYKRSKKESEPVTEEAGEPDDDVNDADDYQEGFIARPNFRFVE